MKSARRLVAMMLAMLMVFALFSGCANQDAVVDDDAAPVVSDTVVSDTVVTSEADAVVEDDAAVEETASGESANSDVTMDLMLYYIETRGWSTHNSNTITVTPDGGTFTFSFDIDHLNLTSIGSMYIKDKNHNMMLTGKSPFSSVSIAIEKYSVNGVEYEALNKDANGNLIYDEAIGGNGVFDYAFVNQWWTDGLKLANFEIPHENGSYAFTGDYYTDKYNHFELTVSIKPIDSANILSEKETRRELLWISLNKSSTAVELESTATLTCDAFPPVCETYVQDWDSAINWTSSDESVATVSGGVITPVSEGTAVITASYGGYSASCNVTVTVKPTAVLRLYGYINWSTYSGEDVILDADSTGNTYDLTLSWGAQGWGGVTTLYIKDVASADSDGAESTLFPNAVITLNSLTYNGINLELQNNESLVAGDTFNIELLNAWYTPNNKVVDDQTVLSDGCYYSFTDEEGNAAGENWSNGNEFVLNFTVDTME